MVVFATSSCNKDTIPYPTPNPVKPEQVTFTENGITLQWKSSVANFSAEIKKNLIETFFNVYPKIVADYNTGAPKTVTFEIVPVVKIGEYEYPAFTSGNTITFSANYLVNNATDWDIVTHEAVHVKQSNAQYEGWLTEGIADYIRY